MRTVAGLFACALVGLGALSAVPAAAYPEKPVTMVVVFPAGGATDLVGRVLQPALAQALGVDVVVKNTGGGGGTIGTAEVAAARPDGYTIGLAPIGPTTTQPHLRTLPYDTLKDLTPICRIYDSPVVMMSSRKSKYATVDDVIKASKAQPRSVVYGTPAPGSIPHVVMVAFEQSAGIEMKHLPFPGSAAIVKEMLGGTVDLLGDVGNLVPKYELRAMAVYADRRMPEFPDAPTMKELRHDLQFSIWGGLFGPAKLPADIVKKLSDACGAALKAKSVIEGMEKQQTEIAYQDASTFAAFVQNEHAKNGKVLAASGLKKE